MMMYSGGDNAEWTKRTNETRTKTNTKRSPMCTIS